MTTIIPFSLPGKKKKTVATASSKVSTQNLYEEAFDKSAEAHIVFRIKTGEVVVANAAACRLLGYSATEILSKHKSAIFADYEKEFKTMLLQREAEGQVIAKVNAILHTGELFPCEVSSAILRKGRGRDNSITTIRDLRAAIALQQNIDVKKEKIVENNIAKAKEKSDLDMLQSSQFLKHFAETSYDVMWDWDISTGKIFVGNSIEEIFGYKLQNDVIDYRIIHRYFSAEDWTLLSLNIKKALSSRKKSWEGSFGIHRKDGQVSSTTSRACIIRNEKGIAIRLVGATQDVSKLIALEKNLQDQSALHEDEKEKFRLASKLSFDVIWDWDLTNNNLYIGEGFKELFGYSIKKNKGDMQKDWVKYICPEDKESITTELANTIRSKAKYWKHAYRMIRANGTIARVFVRATIIRNAAGRAVRMMGAVQDLSRQKYLEEQLDKEVKNTNDFVQQYEENFRLIFNSSSDIFFDVDLRTNTVVLSDAFEKKMGYKVINNMASGTAWMRHIHPDDKERLENDYRIMLQSKETEWKYNFKYLRADNSVISIIGSSIVLRHADGMAYRIIGSMLDTDKHKNIEEHLSAEIASKEAAMLCAVQEARNSERSEIGKELHDNVNQLLGASKLYMEMAKKGGKNSKTYLARSTEYTLTAIEEIRKLTKGLTSDSIEILGLLEAFRNLSSDIMQIQNIQIMLDLDPAVENLLSVKAKLNLYRITQEQFNNILKHSGAATVSVSLKLANNAVSLKIVDDGKGFNMGETRNGIGLNNINERARAIGATSEIWSAIGEGTMFNLELDLGATPI